MIYAIIALIIAGVVIALLAILAYLAISDSHRFRLATDMATAGKQHLKAENANLQRENQELIARNADLSEAYRELEARNTALVEAMEARPTQPKRTVRKSTSGGEQS